jgi:manganese-dependent inorganic pyrophosphatase
MNKTLIFGHKSPDTDTVTSSVVMADIEKKLGNEAESCILGKLNKETKFVFNYLKIEEPKFLEKVEEGQPVILVDHNEFAQSVCGIENANVLKVVDHHRISDFKTDSPLYYRAEPVGSTATVLYKLYKENDLEIDKTHATLMLSAIISDTLLFKSPTCTTKDREVAEKLSKIADINIEEYGIEMLKAGTDLADLTEEELINLDSKEVLLKDVKSVIAQINTASIPDVMKRKEKLEEKIKEVINEKELDLFVFAITDIINSNSQVIVLGDKSKVVETAYDVVLNDNTALLKGVVSRKKQIIPIITNVL